MCNYWARGHVHAIAAPEVNLISPRTLSPTGTEAVPPATLTLGLVPPHLNVGHKQSIAGSR